MNWHHIADNRLLGVLNHLHAELVYNGVTNIAQNPYLTVSDLRELLAIVEHEIASIAERDDANEAGK